MLRCWKKKTIKKSPPGQVEYDLRFCRTKRCLFLFVYVDTERVNTSCFDDFGRTRLQYCLQRIIFFCNFSNVLLRSHNFPRLGTIKRAFYGGQTKMRVRSKRINDDRHLSKTSCSPRPQKRWTLYDCNGLDTFYSFTIKTNHPQEPSERLESRRDFYSCIHVYPLTFTGQTVLNGNLRLENVLIRR